MPRGVTFWTAYRRFYVTDSLRSGVPKHTIAFRLGVTERQLTTAIYSHDLRPRLLELADG